MKKAWPRLGLSCKKRGSKSMNENDKVANSDNGHNIGVTFDTDVNKCDISEKAISEAKLIQGKINMLFNAVDPARAASLHITKDYVMSFFDEAIFELRQHCSAEELASVEVPIAMLKASFILCMLIESDCMPRVRINELKQDLSKTSFVSIKAFSDSFMKTVEPYVDSIKFNMCTIGNTIYGLNELLVDMAKGQPNDKAVYATLSCMSLLMFRFVKECGTSTSGTSNVAQA